MTLQLEGKFAALTSRWTPLRYHPEQWRLWTSKARFRCVPAGRRSGKTELAKRYIVKQALGQTQWDDAWYVCAAPTAAQAKRIYWRDLKALIPPDFIDGKPGEVELTIRLINGSEISLLGMDEPARIEGRPLNGVVLDEFGNMRPMVWQENVRPALSDRRGWAWPIGVPEGRNHYYDMVQAAYGSINGEWDVFHWESEDVLDADEIASAKAALDPLTYDQEYRGSFVNFSGQAYYQFHRGTHGKWRLPYNRHGVLSFCFDFNVAPGVAAVVQEHPKSSLRFDTERMGEDCSCVIGEVYVPRGSNTVIVCDRLINDWAHHKGEIHLYGDATGGATGSAKIDGSDWEIIHRKMKAAFGSDRIRMRVKTQNPPQKARLNAMNSRIKATDGTVRFFVDPVKAPNVVKDLEGVRVIEGGSGEIDKKIDPRLSHISDAVGYYIEKKFPITGFGPVVQHVI